VTVSELGPFQASQSGVAGAPTGFELINVSLSSLVGALSGPTHFDALLLPNGTIVEGQNEGGGTQDLVVAVANPTMDPTAPADATLETRVTFTNRSLPGIVKVCKIAGPGIDPNTPFVFEVRGTIQIPNPAPSGTINQFPAFSAPASVRFVEVLAGPANQGGNCTIVRDANNIATRFQIGTAVVVRELGALAPGVAFDPNPEIEPPTVEQLLDADGVLRDIRISRIRTFRLGPNGAVTPGDFAAASSTTGTTYGVNIRPNPDITPNTALATSDDRASSVGSIDLGRANVLARREEISFEFTDILFNPTELKICKIAGNGIDLGREFTFTVTLNPVLGGGAAPNNVNLLPAFTQQVTVQAGPADNGGFCTVVIPGTANTGSTGVVGGFFNVGDFVTITETLPTGIQVTGVTSTTTPLSGTGATRVAGALVDGTNVITVTNATGTPGLAAARFDFDGDHKSDASIFTPGTARWTYAASGNGNTAESFSFGRATDKLVAADYDGDGVTDRAVFRPENGQWYWLGSASNEYRITQWGQAGDIPLAGDFDGDNLADMVVFRPSNGTWYMNRTREGFAVFQFGVSTDKPVPADYDGDGKMDAAVFRGGQWFVYGTRNGFWVFNFGTSTDKPVPADYDGDGKADAAVIRSNGSAMTWYILGSAGRFDVINFGGSSDQPVPADYDGDRKTDMAVRSADGKWTIRRSSLADAGNEMSTINLGDGSDVAIPGL